MGEMLVILYYTIFGWPNLCVGERPDSQTWNVQCEYTNIMVWHNIMGTRWRKMTKKEIIQHG